MVTTTNNNNNKFLALIYIFVLGLVSKTQNKYLENITMSCSTRYIIQRKSVKIYRKYKLSQADLEPHLEFMQIQAFNSLCHRTS